MTRLDALGSLNAGQTRSISQLLSDLAQPYSESVQAQSPQIPLLLWMIYQNRRDLQLHFSVQTRAGRSGLISWFRTSGPSEYGLEASVVEMMLSGRVEAPLADEPHPSQPPLRGANLIGYARAELGMGEHVRMSALSFETTDCRFGVNNFSAGTSSRQKDGLVDHLLQAAFPHRANLFHINADQMLLAFARLGASCFADRYNIGFWAWELPFCPPQWIPVLSFVDEVWAPSQFIREAFQQVTSKPVVHMPLCVSADTTAVWTKANFGLDEGAFTFLFTFDSFSYFERKNPFGVVTAFRRAFPHRDEAVELVIKTMNADRKSLQWKQLQTACDGDRRIRIITETFERDKVLGLISVCDSYISLHRSEGFGRGPAEAMYHGKPVITTGYSGNTDFCTPETSCLVDYSLVSVLPGQYPLPNGQVWADPDIDQAIWCMRKLAADPSICRKFGQAGQENIRRNYSPRAVGQNMADRLRYLDLA